MTEDEARTKWCPFVRAAIISVTANDIPPHNRASSSSNPDINGINCIASDCMMWRWFYADAHGDPLVEHVHSGHCGLAK
jgi:hypothetical protein